MIGRPLRPVRADEVAAYDRDGVVHLPGLFDPAWTRLMADAVDAAIAAPGPHGEDYVAPGGGGRFFGDLDLWRRHAPFRHFVLDSPAGEIAATIMGSSTATFFYDQLLVKEPGTAERTPWHQDQPYYNVDGLQNVSMWMPVDPVAAESTLEFLAGSHEQGWLLPRSFMDSQAKWFPEGSLSELPDIESDRSAHPILGWALEPGDVVMFHMLAVHHSYGVPGASRRRAFSLRFLGDDMTHAPRHWRTSPPFPGLEDELPAGAPMDHPLFPLLRSPS